MEFTGTDFMPSQETMRLKQDMNDYKTRAFIVLIVLFISVLFFQPLMMAISLIMFGHSAIKSNILNRKYVVSLSKDFLNYLNGTV